MFGMSLSHPAENPELATGFYVYYGIEEKLPKLDVVERLPEKGSLFC
jgi:hypothetical protein